MYINGGVKCRFPNGVTAWRYAFPLPSSKFFCLSRDPVPGQALLDVLRGQDQREVQKACADLTAPIRVILLGKQPEVVAHACSDL